MALQKSGQAVSDTLKSWRDKNLTTIPGTDLAKRAAMEIVAKYWRNEETPYIVGYEIEWSVYYFLPQFMNPGGYVEDPVLDATPQLPDYFWSPYQNGLISSETIWDDFRFFNPQCYSSTGQYSGDTIISWLRKADRVEYERTWFKVTRRWIGTPIGFWDADLYSQNGRPLLPSQFQQIAVPGLAKIDVNTAFNAGWTGIPAVIP